MNVAECSTPHPGLEYWNDTPDSTGVTEPDDRSTANAYAPRASAWGTFTRLPGSTVTAANRPSPDRHSYPNHDDSSRPPGSMTATSDHAKPEDSRATWRWYPAPSPKPVSATSEDVAAPGHAAATAASRDGASSRVRGLRPAW